jgi:hypothetical protein
MNEETTPPATEQPSIEETPVAMVNTDGTFADNWNTMLQDESLHEDKTLPRIKDVESLAKSYIHVRKQVPLDKMARPNENWGDSDWEEFYKAGGRPDTAADYNIKKPDDFPAEIPWDEDLIKGYQDLFHKIGLSKKQSDALIAFNNTTSMEAYQKLQQKQDMDFTTLKDALTKKWGMAYDQNVHLGNIAIDKGSKGDLEYKERLVQKVNADPDLVEFTSNLGSLFAEHKIVEDTNIPTPADIETRIKEEMNKPEYTNRNHPNHKYQVKLVQQLFQEKVKYAKTG